MSPYDPARHGPRRVVGPGFHEAVWALVREVPPGWVTTYGDLATRLGHVGAARHVGWALSALPSDRVDVPWHRVVNGRGRVSARGDGAPAPEQRRRLRAEGVRVGPDGRVQDFASRRWVW